MKLSWRWLNLYLDGLELAPEQAAAKLTMATAEVEDVHHLQRRTAGLQVARVAEAQPIEGHPAHALVLDLGGGRTARTVCTAPNVRVGMHSVYAPAGATLTGGQTVEPREVYGQPSEGVLGSPDELDWGPFHQGVVELGHDVEPGDSVDQLAPGEDWLIEIDNKSVTHRADLWGHYGFARELAAITGARLRPLDRVDLDRFNHLPEHPVTIDEPERCPGYCALAIDGAPHGPAPLWMQLLLLAVGQRPIDLLVDLTNFIMFEIGQPTHAFDRDHTPSIRVGLMDPPGPFTTLDGVERQMTAEDLMIFTERTPVAVAGVMGGHDSEVTPETRRLLLESANFEAMGVRRTATRLNLGSEASKRFEKSQPRCHMQQAIARFVHLLDDAGHDFEVVSRLSCAQPQPEAPRTIDLPVGQLRRRMGIELPVEHAEAILTSLEFQVEHLQGEGEGDGRLRVTPPPHRTPRDQALPEDLIEEIARVYGYDNIAPSMPAVTMAPQPLDRRRRAERAIRQFLSSACGRREVHTYSWYDDAFLHRIEFNPGATLTLRNPSAPETARMRTSMLPNLLQVAAQNEVHEDDIAIYELGRTYRPVGESDRDERTVLGVVDAAIPRAASLESLFARLKGQALELLELLTADPGAVKTEQVDADASRPWETPGAVLAIKPAGAADLTLGKLGYASSSTKRWFRQGTRVAWMELDIDLVLKHLQPITPRYQPPPVHPGSWMDFSLLWPTDRRFAELEAIVTGFAHPLRRGVRYLTSYRGKELKGQASHSFRFQLQAESGTLSGDQIQGFRDDFIAYLKGHGVALR